MKKISSPKSGSVFLPNTIKCIANSRKRSWIDCWVTLKLILRSLMKTLLPDQPMPKRSILFMYRTPRWLSRTTPLVIRYRTLRSHFEHLTVEPPSCYLITDVLYFNQLMIQCKHHLTGLVITAFLPTWKNYITQDSQQKNTSGTHFKGTNDLSRFENDTLVDSPGLESYINVFLALDYWGLFEFWSFKAILF